MFKRIIVAISIVTSVFAGFVWYNENWQTFLYASFMTGVMYLRYWVIRVLFLAKSFVFVGGVVSFAIIAWKKVLLASALALLKRAWINSMVAVINHRIKIFDPSIGHDYRSFWVWEVIWEAESGIKACCN